MGTLMNTTVTFTRVGSLFASSIATVSGRKWGFNTGSVNINKNNFIKEKEYIWHTNILAFSMIKLCIQVDILFNQTLK